MYRSIYSFIAPLGSSSLWSVPRITRLYQKSLNHRSTLLNHDKLVGTKCKWSRGCLSTRRFTFTVLCFALDWAALPVSREHLATLPGFLGRKALSYAFSTEG